MKAIIYFPCMVLIWFTFIGCSTYHTLGTRGNEGKNSTDWSKQENLNHLKEGARYRISLKNGNELFANLVSVDEHSLSVRIPKEDRIRNIPLDRINRIEESRFSTGKTIGLFAVLIGASIIYGLLTFEIGGFPIVGF
jgi:hypothetical protein